MFAKLRMTVEEASDEFCTIIEEVYKQEDVMPKERTRCLKTCIEGIMVRKGLPVDMKLLDETRPGGCAWSIISSNV